MVTLCSSVFSEREGYSSSACALTLPKSAGIEASFTYTQLSQFIAHVQEQLGALELPPGTVVSSSLVNSVEFVVAFLATAEQGLIAAPLNPNYKDNEVSFYLEDTASRLLIVPSGAIKGENVSEGARAAVSAARALKVPVVEITLDASMPRVTLVSEEGPLKTGEKRTASETDTALVLHTSGTTGRPKAVPLSHRNLITTMHNIQETYHLCADDTTYLVMPLFHVHGLVCGLLASLLAGSRIVVPPRFSASVFWNELTQSQANWYTAVPTIHQIVLTLERPVNAPKLRFVRSCSSSLSPATFFALEKMLDAPVLEAYAMTEAAHQMTSNPYPPAKRKPGTVGLGHGVEVRILDESGHERPQGQNGEVCVRGANITAGYLHNEKANRDSFFRISNGNCPPESDGFLRTGDQGHKDEDGYLVLTGRIKELINRGGEKISPLEIDSALLAVPGIQEAVSFGVPDEIYGEQVGAAVVLSKDAKLDADAIKNKVSESISKFKVPTHIWIVEQIPKTATGKIQRRNVAAAMH